MQFFALEIWKFCYVIDSCNLSSCQNLTKDNPTFWIILTPRFGAKICKILTKTSKMKREKTNIRGLYSNYFTIVSRIYIINSYLDYFDSDRLTLTLADGFCWDHLWNLWGLFRLTFEDSLKLSHQKVLCDHLESSFINTHLIEKTQPWSICLEYYWMPPVSVGVNNWQLVDTICEFLNF